MIYDPVIHVGTRSWISVRDKYYILITLQKSGVNLDLTGRIYLSPLPQLHPQTYNIPTLVASAVVHSKVVNQLLVIHC